MRKLEDGRYEVALRQIYLELIDKVRGGLDRDACIQELLKKYLELPELQRLKEYSDQHLRGGYPADKDDSKPRLAIIDVSLSDDDVEKLGNLDAYTDKHINAAIRLWLLSKGIKDVRP